eukprot:5202205-Pyramimonas_sp.AAC.1
MRRPAAAAAVTTPMKAKKDKQDKTGSGEKKVKKTDKARVAPVALKSLAYPGIPKTNEAPKTCGALRACVPPPPY